MEINQQLCITRVCATVLSLFGLPVNDTIDKPNEAVTQAAKKKFGGKNAERVILYNPDAVALWLYNKHPAMFSEAQKASCVAMTLRSVMPSVTPVCFASMYSGLMPEKHGIQSYTKPVLQVDTLFDYCIKAGKKCAIVSTAGDSISKIFLDRAMDYYIYPSLAQVNRKALKLIKEDKYDLLVIYNGNYDSTMHAKGPEHKKSLKALEQNLSFYKKLTDCIHKYLAEKTVFYGFCPDHGCHLIDGQKGSHGLSMEEDMNVIHLYGFQ